MTERRYRLRDVHVGDPGVSSGDLKSWFFDELLRLGREAESSLCDGGGGGGDCDDGKPSSSGLSEPEAKLLISFEAFILLVSASAVGTSSHIRSEHDRRSCLLGSLLGEPSTFRPGSALLLLLRVFGAIRPGSALLLRLGVLGTFRVGSALLLRRGVLGTFRTGSALLLRRGDLGVFLPESLVRTLFCAKGALLTGSALLLLLGVLTLFRTRSALLLVLGELAALRRGSALLLLLTGPGAFCIGSKLRLLSFLLVQGTVRVLSKLLSPWRLVLPTDEELPTLFLPRTWEQSGLSSTVFLLWLLPFGLPPFGLLRFGLLPFEPLLSDALLAWWLLFLWWALRDALLSEDLLVGLAFLLLVLTLDAMLSDALFVRWLFNAPVSVAAADLVAPLCAFLDDLLCRGVAGASGVSCTCCFDTIVSTSGGAGRWRSPFSDSNSS